MEGLLSILLARVCVVDLYWRRLDWYIWFRKRTQKAVSFFFLEKTHAFLGRNVIFWRYSELATLLVCGRSEKKSVLFSFYAKQRFEKQPDFKLAFRLISRSHLSELIVSSDIPSKEMILVCSADIFMYSWFYVKLGTFYHVCMHIWKWEA